MGSSKSKPAQVVAQSVRTVEPVVVKTEEVVDPAFVSSIRQVSQGIQEHKIPNVVVNQSSIKPLPKDRSKVVESAERNRDMYKWFVETTSSTASGEEGKASVDKLNRYFSLAERKQ